MLFGKQVSQGQGNNNSKPSSKGNEEKLKMSKADIYHIVLILIVNMKENKTAIFLLMYYFSFHHTVLDLSLVTY